MSFKKRSELQKLFEDSNIVHELKKCYFLGDAKMFMSYKNKLQISMPFYSGLVPSTC